jgi:hypothetical protein
MYTEGSDLGKYRGFYVRGLHLPSALYSLYMYRISRTRDMLKEVAYRANNAFNGNKDWFLITSYTELLQVRPWNKKIKKIKPFDEVTKFQHDRM